MGSSGDQVMSSQLPPGFRFHPTDQELINCYLRMKINGSVPSEWGIIADIDLYNFDPWELPERAFFGEREWFFFSHRNRKYPNGDRPNRAASSGYWKATGTDKLILAIGGSECIGVKKTLVFYKGRPPKGIKTEWVMQEYRLMDSMDAPFQSLKQNDRSMKLDDWVLCRVQQKLSLRTVNGEVTETCIPTESIGAHSEETQGVVMEGNSFPEWRDNQLLLGNYPVESHETAESTLEDSDPALHMRISHLGGRGDYLESLQCWSSPLIIPSVYGLKRKVPFGALDDELMLMQPAVKRFQFLADGLLSLAE